MQEAWKNKPALYAVGSDPAMRDWLNVVQFNPVDKKEIVIGQLPVVGWPKIIPFEGRTILLYMIIKHPTNTPI